MRRSWKQRLLSLIQSLAIVSAFGIEWAFTIRMPWKTYIARRKETEMGIEIEMEMEIGDGDLGWKMEMEDGDGDGDWGMLVPVEMGMAVLHEIPLKYLEG